MKGLHQLRPEVLDVLDQRQARRQLQVRQQLERCRPQQLRIPGMEGADLDHAPALQQALVEADQVSSSLAGSVWRHAIHGKFRGGFLRRHPGAALQTVEQARAHLAGCLAGEGDGEDLLWLRAVEQRTNDAGHQHPGLPRAGAGLDHDVAARVARHAVEALRRHDTAVQAVGGLCHASPQWSRRHRPRAGQWSQAGGSPNATAPCPDRSAARSAARPSTRRRALSATS
jgi:hypothetical protein